MEFNIWYTRVWWRYFNFSLVIITLQKSYGPCLVPIPVLIHFVSSLQLNQPKDKQLPSRFLPRLLSLWLPQLHQMVMEWNVFNLYGSANHTKTIYYCFCWRVVSSVEWFGTLNILILNIKTTNIINMSVIFWFHSHPNSSAACCGVTWAT